VQPPATFRLNELSVKLLVERGDTAALRACADAGNWQAREPLVKLLVERGDIDALRAYADAGESWAAHRLVDVLAERGDFEALRARADAGDSHAAGRLAERGDFDALSRSLLGGLHPVRVSAVAVTRAVRRSSSRCANQFRRFQYLTLPADVCAALADQHSLELPKYWFGG
jgi:hypothetical protein